VLNVVTSLLESDLDINRKVVGATLLFDSSAIWPVVLIPVLISFAIAEAAP
jgi:hypothetical protein